MMHPMRRGAIIIALNEIGLRGMRSAEDELQFNLHRAHIHASYGPPALVQYLL